MDVSWRSAVMRSEVPGVERRRRWSDEEKLSIVASVGTNGASVTDIAFRHEITRSQIYGWRRDLKLKGLLAPDAPVRFLSLPRMPLLPDDPPEPGISDEVVEIVLRGGRSLRVPAGLGEATLARLIRVTEAAWSGPGCWRISWCRGSTTIFRFTARTRSSPVWAPTSPTPRSSIGVARACGCSHRWWRGSKPTSWAPTGCMPMTPPSGCSIAAGGSRASARALRRAASGPTCAMTGRGAAPPRPGSLTSSRRTARASIRRGT